MVEVCAEDFADYPVMQIICCGRPMEAFHAEYVRDGEGETNRLVTRLGRGCWTCQSTVITSLTVRAPEGVTPAGTTP